LTFHGVLKLFAGKSAELSADYPAERHAFLLYNPRKVFTFHRLSCGKVSEYCVEMAELFMKKRKLSAE
jgi:hypothetical protein